jgi:hypothetical protein
LPAKSVECAEHAQENLLRQIQRLFAVSQQMGREAEHKPMVLEHESGVGCVITGQAALDQRGLTAGNF